MRKVTSTIARAFRDGKAAKVKNTETDGTGVWLHGSLIAMREQNGDIRMTLAGYNTPTTRDRLNGIATVCNLNVRFGQKDHLPVLRWKEGNDWQEDVISARDMVAAQPME